jgi:uncharacterized protein (TIGR03437 family)
MHVPTRVIGRAHQSSISFQAAIDDSASTDTVLIQAAAGEAVAEERITIEASQKPELTVHGKQFAMFGKKLTFGVTTSSGTLAADALPAGASFDATTGTFEWTPQSSQHGLFRVKFSATDLSRRSSEADVQIQTGDGSPVIDSIENAASGSADSVCSSGSLATIRGGWLAPESQVFVNGAAVQTVFSSPEQVSFVCPAAAAGTNLEISVANHVGRSAARTVVLRDAAPGIFTVAGSTQAAGTILNGSQLAMPRNHRFFAQPAQAGDKVQLPVTGLPADADPQLVELRIGDVQVPANALAPVPGVPGVVNVALTLPNGAPTGDSVPVSIHYRSRDGQVFTSQRTTIAIEPVR